MSQYFPEMQQGGIFFKAPQKGLNFLQSPYFQRWTKTKLFCKLQK